MDIWLVRRLTMTWITGFTWRGCEGYLLVLWWIGWDQGRLLHVMHVRIHQWWSIWILSRICWKPHGSHISR